MRGGIGRSNNRRWWLLLPLLLCACLSVSLNADTFSERRIHVGLKLFRTFLSADLALSEKLNDAGRVEVALLYASDELTAARYLPELEQALPEVKKLPVQLNTLALSSLSDAPRAPAAMFITQPLNREELQQVISYGREHRVMVFSPFEGDVRDGVAGGLSVESTVRPALNMTTLKASGLELKAFYLTVAKQYE